MRRFTDYKDSGSDRIGYMPNHWTIRRIKDIGAIQYGLGQPPEYKETGLPFVRATNVTKGKITDEGLVYVAAEDVPTSRNPLLRENDIIVVRSGANTADSALVPARYAGAVAGYDMVIRAKSIVPHYLSYSLLSSYLLESQLQLQSFRAAQPHLNKEQLGHALVLCPPLPEQQAIADYLDAKTAQIDRKIGLLTQKAAKYRQLKQAILNAAVTQGLDQSAPMKDSGVEWIGEVPANWQMYRHKDCLSLVTNRCGDSSLTKVALENIEGQTGRYIPTENEYDGDGIQFRIGDILFGKLRPYLAKVYLAEFEGSAVGDIFVYRPKPNILSGFAQRLMLSKRYLDVINSSTAGAKMPRVSADFISDLPVFVPSLPEQHAIIQFLDDRTGQIDRIVEAINTQVDKLQYLRKSLINAVVTGKLRVT